MLALTPVTLRFHSHPSVLLVIGGLGVFFWWAFTKLGPSLVESSQVEPGEVVATRRQKQWIAAGLAWTFVFSYWPLHDIAEKYLFLAHMLQHSVFTMVAPACFLLGAPSWLWRWVIDKPVIGAVVRFGSKPLVALLVFNALIAGTHWPRLVEKTLHNEWLHFSIHFVLFSAATLMWIPVINREPRLPRLKTPAKMMYLFAQSIVPTVPASFLAMSNTVMYPTYAKAGRIIHGFDAIGDQQIAAAIMKLGVGSLLWGIVGYLFANWWRDTNAGLADDNMRAVVKASGPVRVAGMTISGGRVEAPAVADSDVLTWDQVEAEFARLDAAAPPVA
jgi:putative membrane protein